MDHGPDRDRDLLDQRIDPFARRRLKNTPTDLQASNRQSHAMHRDDYLVFLVEVIQGDQGRTWTPFFGPRRDLDKV
jgi:hypothetical protein